MRIRTVFLLTVVALAPSMGVAEPTARLRVSATILPKPCEYPDRCEHITSKSVPGTATRVVVSAGTVSYVGSSPTVEKKNDLLVVKF